MMRDKCLRLPRHILVLAFFLFLVGLSPSQIALYQQHINEGISYLEKKSYQLSEDSFWKALRLSPDNPDAYINLATVYIQKGNPNGALKILIHAQKVAKEGYKQKDILFYNLGISSYMKSDYTKAMEYFNEALSVRPDFSEAMYYLGISFDKLGQKDQSHKNILMAKEIFDKEGKTEYKKKAAQFLENITPKNKVPVKKAKVVKKEYFKKKEVAKEVVKVEAKAKVQEKKAVPKKIKDFYAEGKKLLKNKKHRRALTAFKKALKIDKNNPFIYYDMAAIYIHYDKLAAAKKYLNKAEKIANRNNNDDLFIKIKITYNKIDNIQKAKAKAKAKKEKKRAKTPSSPKTSGNKGNFSGGSLKSSP